jgi:hypothetical protein
VHVELDGASEQVADLSFSLKLVLACDVMGAARQIP